MKEKLKKVFWAGIICVVLAGVLIAVFGMQEPDDSAVKKALEETRQSLRQQGFKTDLTDFDLSAPPDVRARSDDIVNNSMSLPPGPTRPRFNSAPLAGTDSIVVLWREDGLQGYSQEGETVVHWPELQELMDSCQAPLDEVCRVAADGPIQFSPDPRSGSGMRLPFLSPLRNLESMLTSRMLLELHGQHPDAAWTNLLAATHLVTAWKPDPAQISYLVRDVMAADAFNATWQAAQYPGWTDGQLAALQQAWENVNYFTNLTETVAFTRASMVNMVQQDRVTPMGSGLTWPQFFEMALHSPMSAVANMHQNMAQMKYRAYGTYDDEKNLLLFYCDREIEMRDALKATNWEQMRGLPGVTNQIPFVSPYPSRLQSMIGGPPAGTTFARTGNGFLARTAMIEAQRRLLITALALERHHRRYGSYPATLADLTPDFLQAVPDDFMDGQPLRYRLTNDGHFVLYSVGADCVDDGGKIPVRASGRTMRGLGGGLAMMDGDIVWPRPATADEAEVVREKSRNDAMSAADENETRATQFQWSESDRRQANVDQILAEKRASLGKGPDFHGQSLSAVLRNEKTAGTNKLSFEEMLTLKPVLTGNEPDKITFEVPMAYETVTNLGSLALCIDAFGKATDEGFNVQQMECSRDTNGDCRLMWNTIFESPGQHALQLVLELHDELPGNPDLAGPPLACSVSNLCQFAIASANFEPGVIATFHARLPEQNANYSIDCNLPDGTHVKTLTGSTSNGELKLAWDLKDDHEVLMTNEEFNTVVHIKLTDSGRSQTLQGP